MKWLTIDAEVKAKLGGLGEELALADEMGNPVGYVLPPEVYDRLMDASVFRPTTPEERQAILEQVRAGRVYTTAEAIEYVRSGGRKGGAGR